MIEALLDCEEATAPHLARNVLNRMAEQMYEEAEMVLLSGDQDKLDSPSEPDSNLTTVQLTEHKQRAQNTPKGIKQEVPRAG